MTTESAVSESETTQTSTEVATVDPDGVAEQDDEKFEPEPDWKHGSIEFEGDTLNIRKPTEQALTGFSLASSKFVPPSTRNDIAGLFVARHLSPLSYDQVMSRLMDPDDPDYTEETVGELMRLIVETSANEIKAAAAAKNGGKPK